MLDIKRTINNLIGIKGTDVEDLYNEIIAAFDTTGKEVIVSTPTQMNNFNGTDGTHLAYENDKNAPEIKIEIKNLEVVDAWEV